MSNSDTVDWLKKVGKPKAKVSFELEDESEDFSTNFIKPKANAIKDSYSTKDLRGLKVAHDYGSFQAGQSDILVLEDSSVLAGDLKDEGSALVSMSLKEDERLKRLREVARHASGYSGYKEYEEETEDSFLSLGRAKPAKILQKYDFASHEMFNDEPVLVEGFRIGTDEPKLAKTEKLDSVTFKNDDFDTVKAAGIETIFKKKSATTGNEMEKEKKRAKKLAKTLFADEPEMLVESGLEVENETETNLEEEDDFDMQRIISASRREHLKQQQQVNFEREIEGEADDKFIGGKSFDALIMSESIFANKNNLDNQQVANDLQEDNDSEIIVEDVSNSQSNADEEASNFTAEPLVRNGVAATLALLNMRGLKLKPRHSNQEPATKSDVKLEYFDQFGNKLSSKEAYKELSRKFHGKGPGKGKIEKMKRRREETLKMETMSSTSAIATNFRKQQEETGAPYMILSTPRQVETVANDPQKSTNDIKKPKIFGLQIKK